MPSVARNSISVIIVCPYLVDCGVKRSRGWGEPLLVSIVLTEELVTMRSVYKYRFELKIGRKKKTAGLENYQFKIHAHKILIILCFEGHSFRVFWAFVIFSKAEGIHYIRAAWLLLQWTRPKYWQVRSCCEHKTQRTQWPPKMKRCSGKAVVLIWLDFSAYV